MIARPILRVPKSMYEMLNLCAHPNIGPRSSVYNARRLYGPSSWLIACGDYIYDVPKETYIKALEEL